MTIRPTLSKPSDLWKNKVNTMKRTLLMSILIVFFVISFVGCDNKPSTKELYDLQEKCGKQSEVFVKNHKERYGLENGFISGRNHYNKKLNKCFIVTTYVEMDRLTTTYVEPDRLTITLWDVNENESYGECSGGIREDNVFCSFRGKKELVMKKDEWDKLVKPYMTE